MSAALNFSTTGVTSDAGDAARNPLALIEQLCTPADFCVLKLDVDFWELELNITRALLHGPASLRRLVDEFYFEYHMKNKHDHDKGRASHHNSLQSWYALIAPARAKGLRMHMWP